MLAVNPNRRILSVVVTTCDSFGAVLTVFRDCCGNAPHGLVRRSRANALDLNTRAANGPPPNAENRRSGLSSSTSDSLSTRSSSSPPPARAIHEDRSLGTLQPGAAADVTVLSLVEGPVELAETMGEQVNAPRRLVPTAVVRAGRRITLQSRRSGAAE